MQEVPPNVTSRASRRRWLVAVALAAVWSVRAAPSAPAAPPSAPADAPPVVASPSVVQAPWVHGYASYGEPKYPRGFDHFGYVNPTAPKGGTLYLRNPDRRSSFDKFNPFTITGNAPAALMLFVIEPLAVMAGDEPQTMYGVLAEEMQVAPDKSSMSFRIHPKARFQNGDPVTAADVKYSFESLSSKYAAPAYQTALAGVEKASVIDERTIRFDLKDRSNDMVFTVGTLRVFSRKWALGPDGQPKRFDQIVTEYPIASGPIPDRRRRPRAGASS